MTRGLIPPVVKELHVPCTPEAAFRAFTTEIAAWWPSVTHSLGSEKVARIVFEERLGGSIYEQWKDGTRESWGSILEWDPPRRVTFSWHVGRPPAQASRVTISFSPDGPGAIVRLIHSDWETFGEAARDARDRYESGWSHVLVDRFVNYLRGAGSGAARS